MKAVPVAWCVMVSMSNAKLSKAHYLFSGNDLSVFGNSSAPIGNSSNVKSLKLSAPSELLAQRQRLLAKRTQKVRQIIFSLFFCACNPASLFPFLRL